MAEIEIEVGSSLDRLGADFIAAWKAAETGQTVVADRRIHFRDWAALCAVLTPERYDLLRQLKRDPGSEPAAVSCALGRDEDQIAEDVEVLAELGLVVRAEDGRLTAPPRRDRLDDPLRGLSTLPFKMEVPPSPSFRGERSESPEPRRRSGGEMHPTVAILRVGRGSGFRARAPRAPE